MKKKLKHKISAGLVILMPICVQIALVKLCEMIEIADRDSLCLEDDLVLPLGIFGLKIYEDHIKKKIYSPAAASVDTTTAAGAMHVQEFNEDIRELLNITTNTTNKGKNSNNSNASLSKTKIFALLSSHRLDDSCKQDLRERMKFIETRVSE